MAGWGWGLSLQGTMDPRPGHHRCSRLGLGLSLLPLLFLLACNAQTHSDRCVTACGLQIEWLEPNDAQAGFSSCDLASMAEANGLLAFASKVGFDPHQSCSGLDGWTVSIAATSPDGSFVVQEPDGPLTVYGATDIQKKQLMVDGASWRHGSFFHELGHAQQWIAEGVIDAEHTDWQARHYYDAIDMAQKACP